MALLMSTTATLTQPNTQDIPTPTQPTTTTPITQKSKKRARFADENQNEPQQQQQQQQQQQSLSSFITFNHDDPPLKKAKTQKHESSSFDLFDLSASGKHLQQQQKKKKKEKLHLTALTLRSPIRYIA
jgi:hypothetical protein